MGRKKNIMQFLPPTDTMIKDITEKILKSILPIELNVNLKIYKATGGSYVLQVTPIDEKK